MAELSALARLTDDMDEEPGNLRLDERGLRTGAHELASAEGTHRWLIRSIPGRAGLRVRDWLRTNPADRQLYARTKSVLAEKEWQFVQNYADAKSAVIDDIMNRARQHRSR